MKQLPLLLVSILISACGSGEDPLGSSNGLSFTGNQQAASITAENAEAIGLTAGEAVQYAALTGALPSPITVVNGSNAQINFETRDSVSDDFAASAILNICMSGSAESTLSQLTNGKESQTIIYSRCRLSTSNITANGKLVAIYNDIDNLNSGFSLTYSNFSLSNSTSSDLRLNVKVACSTLASCSYQSDFNGSDNRIHRITAFNLSGNASSGLNGSASLYHERHGKVSIASSGLSYAKSCGQRPNGGVIAFSSTNSSGTINFDSDCTVSGTWSNSFGSGSF